MKTKACTTSLAAIALMLFSAAGALAQTEAQRGAQTSMQPDMSTMGMDPYFTALNYPVPQDTMTAMLLSDFQSARSTNDFFTGMGMVQMRPHAPLDGGVHGGGAENLRIACYLRRVAGQ